MPADEKAFGALKQVVETLLGPGGCPWDQEQTPASLCDYLIEECFELVEAIRADNHAEAREELGDVLFLLVFIGQLYARQNALTLADALEEAAAKMVRRHPHVFGDEKFEGTEELMRTWERIKRQEKETASGDKPAGLFDSLPKRLPPLLKAYRINSKAARVGFTWGDDAGVSEQLAAEWQEWQEAVATGNQQAKEEEFGDYLFTLAEYGRRHGIKANAALALANRKFLTRFAAMEDLARAKGASVQDMTLDELNQLWEQAKAAPTT